MKTTRDKMLSVRTTAEEKKRVKDFAAEIRRANPYITEADVLRELIGLEDTGLITPEMRQRLRLNMPVLTRNSLPSEPRRQHPTAPRIPQKAKGGKK